jgi:hypothetical protein
VTVLLPSLLLGTDALPIRVSTLRAAVELKAVFEQIQTAEKAGNLSPEEKKRLEEQAAEKGLRALFMVTLYFRLLVLESQRTSPLKQGAKFEIESVLRETCDLVLNDPTISQRKAELRAVGLQILGEAYMSVKKTGEGEPSPLDEYVRVERSNREREQQARR